METSFLDLARQGKNDWWRYALSTVVILVSWLGGSVVLFIPMFAISLMSGSRPVPNPETGEITGVDPLLLVTTLLLSFLPLLISLLLAVRFIHQRSLTSLITPLPRIDWKRMAIGFLAFGVLIGLACIVEAFLFPGRYQFTFEPLETLKFVPVILLLIPFQAASEELVFRGYMLQGIGLLTRQAWIPVTISSLLFMLLHISNPEAQTNTVLALASYLVSALIFALVTIRDNRLELAIGMHIANNVFVLLVNNVVSTLPVPSVFTVMELDVVYNLVSLIVIGVIFYVGLHLSDRKADPAGI